MSGHSKWATTHRQKEANDAKKGAAFTKLAMNITVAVRQGGGIGDPDQNFRLRLAIEKAREFNMPKENIQRSIERAMGTGGETLTESLYEGFLPGGASVLVSTLADNKLRIAQQVREIMDRNGGTMGSSGSVAYLFSNLGEVVVKDKPGKSLDEQELEIIDAGAEEMEAEGENIYVYCHKDRLMETKNKLEQAGFKIESVELTMKPTMEVEVKDPELREKVEKILTLLSDLDDVQKVWTNYA